MTDSPRSIRKSLLPRTAARVGAAVAGIAVLVLVQQFVTVGGNDLLGRTINNWLHVPMFAAVALLLDRVLNHPSWPVLLVACVGLAVLTELLQTVTGGVTGFGDLGRDMLGAVPVIAAIHLSRRPDERGSAGGWMVWSMALFLVGAATIAAPLRVKLAYEERDLLFPRLLEPGNRLLAPLLDTRSEQRLVPAPSCWEPYAGAPVLAVTWADERYPGIQLSEVVPDWQAFETLVVDVYLPGGPTMPLTAAVGHEGRAGTAAHVRRVAEPGAQRLRFEVDALLRAPRSASPPSLSKLILHTDRAQAGRTLLIGTVRLVRHGQDGADTGNLVPSHRPAGSRGGTGTH